VREVEPIRDMADQSGRHRAAERAAEKATARVGSGGSSGSRGHIEGARWSVPALDSHARPGSKLSDSLECPVVA
jgi:hypothetical protein